MSSAKSAEENISQYWKSFFGARQHLLEVRSNEEALEQWKKDHGGQAAPRSALNGLTNIKSQLRAATGVGKKKRRKKKKAAKAVVAAPAAAAARVVRPPMKVLEALEDQIDRCLDVTNNQVGLEKVVAALKHARRVTIHQMAE